MTTTIRLPEGACDCHAHVFGPYDAFPVVHQMHYEAPLATASMYGDMISNAGLSRGVLVQPGAYGDDAGPILDALTNGGGRFRGIAAAHKDISDEVLDNWHEAGIRGLRFNEMIIPGGSGRFAGSVGFSDLDALAPRMKTRGWHAEIWASIEQHVELLPRYRSWGIPICLDHMASVITSRGLDDPAFQAILAAMNEGWLWIKLVATRCSQDFPDYPDLAVFHQALARVRPDRLVWSSDWPHLRLGSKTPDVSHLLMLLAKWIPEETVQRQILVRNPAELYDF
jgi:predicted TIM-barrel fold metal-dependent hydrolase